VKQNTETARCARTLPRFKPSPNPDFYTYIKSRLSLPRGVRQATGKHLSLRYVAACRRESRLACRRIAGVKCCRHLVHACTQLIARTCTTLALADLSIRPTGPRRLRGAFRPPCTSARSVVLARLPTGDWHL